MEHAINAGYEIIGKIKIENTCFVLGHSENKSSPYVTWQYNEQNDSYFYGHYLSNKYDAEKDLIKRAYDKIRFYDQQKGIGRNERDERWLG